MRLTSYTDYALRTLMHLAANRDRLVTISDSAGTHGIAKNHLTKVVHQLGVHGFVGTVRGRSGGLRPGRDPSKICIGDVVRHTETDFYMAACFDLDDQGCPYATACGLKGVLISATYAFLAVLDGVTLDSFLPEKTGRPALNGIEIRNTKRGAGAAFVPGDGVIPAQAGPRPDLACCQPPRTSAPPRHD